MKILITGCAGFIGSSVAREFMYQDKHELFFHHSLFRKSRYQELKEERWDNLRGITNFNFDLCDYDQTHKMFETVKPDYVIHMAGKGGVRNNNIMDFNDSNIVAFSNVIHCSARNGVKRFIYASSSTVLNETYSYYAETKKLNEKIAKMYHSFNNMRCIGLRMFSVYGPYGRPEMAMLRIINGIHKENRIKVVNFGIDLNHPNCVVARDFTYIDDITEFIFLLIEKEEYGDQTIFDLTSNKSTDIGLELIPLLEEKMGKKANVVYVSPQSGDFERSPHIVFSYLRDPTALKHGIDKTLAWYFAEKTTNW